MLLQLGQRLCWSGSVVCQDWPKDGVNVADAIQATGGQGGYRKHRRRKEPVEGKGVAESSLGEVARTEGSCLTELEAVRMESFRARRR